MAGTIRPVCTTPHRSHRSNTIFVAPAVRFSRGCVGRPGMFTDRHSFTPNLLTEYSYTAPGSARVGQTGPSPLRLPSQRISSCTSAVAMLIRRAQQGIGQCRAARCSLARLLWPAYSQPPVAPLVPFHLLAIGPWKMWTTANAWIELGEADLLARLPLSLKPVVHTPCGTEDRRILQVSLAAPKRGR